MIEEVTNKRCPSCKGSGEGDVYDSFGSYCGNCNGTGMILVPYPDEDDE